MLTASPMYILGTSTSIPCKPRAKKIRRLCALGTLELQLDRRHYRMGKCRADLQMKYNYGGAPSGVEMPPRGSCRVAIAGDIC